MFRKSFALVVVMAVGGCGTLPVGTSPMGTVPFEPGTDVASLTPASFDGKWRQSGSPGMNNEACITIQGGALTAADDCAGKDYPITNSQVATISGDQVTWILESSSNGATGVGTFSMTTQPDGSLKGSFSVVSDGETSTHDSITWVRM
ncbi:MAG TPA: hypothetical protein VJZ71_20240 [Phycisphaerae bacterium]|nr:hypothetical protein [Phycisphaerae bacterium]